MRCEGGLGWAGVSERCLCLGGGHTLGPGDIQLNNSTVNLALVWGNGRRGVTTRRRSVRYECTRVIRWICHVMWTILKWMW